MELGSQSTESRSHCFFERALSRTDTPLLPAHAAWPCLTRTLLISVAFHNLLRQELRTTERCIHEHSSKIITVQRQIGTGRGRRRQHKTLVPATVYTSLAMAVHPLRRAPPRRFLHKFLRVLYQRCPPVLVPATVHTGLAPRTVYTLLAMAVHSLRRTPPRRLVHNYLRFLHQRCPPVLVPATVHTLLAMAMERCRRAQYSRSRNSATEN